jgi:hypothetical protein
MVRGSQAAAGQAERMRGDGDWFASTFGPAAARRRLVACLCLAPALFASQSTYKLHGAGLAREKRNSSAFPRSQAAERLLHPLSQAWLVGQPTKQRDAASCEPVSFGDRQPITP